MNNPFIGEKCPVPTPSQYSAPALEKGIEILEALAASRTPQSLVMLSRKLRRSSSELFRMLNCLENRHYIQRDPESGCYRLTLKLYELAHTHSPAEELLTAAVRPMRELTEECGESSHLSVLSRGCQLVLARTESPRPVHLSVEVGGRFPAVLTNSGRLLLAYLRTDDWSEFQQSDPAWRELGNSRRQQLQKQLRHIRTQGYSSAASEMAPGVHDLAVPIGNPALGVIAALAVPLFASPEHVKHADRLLGTMQRCARRITEASGLSPEP